MSRPQLATLFGGALAALIAASAAQAQSVSASDLAQVRAQIEALQVRIRDLEGQLQRAEQRSAAAPAPARTPGSNAFNPAIGLVLDGKFGRFEEDPDDHSIAGFPLAEEAGPGERGFALGEAELNISANVDDLFFGSFTAALEYDDGETEIELEEAYIQTLALPYGLRARAGKFFSDIGYLNAIHAHADDFADRPLAYRAFLADQFGDVGAQASIVAPTPFFLQFGAEAFRGDSFPAEGAANGGVGAKALFVKIGDDLGRSWSYQAGLSYLHAAANELETGEVPDVFAGDSDVAIAHLVLKWAPGGNPHQRNLKLQAELFRNNLDGAFNGIDVDRTAHGLYAQAIWQFMPRWRVGYRYDRLWPDASDDAALAGTALDDQGHDPSRHSAMVEWNYSEFSRIRLQYNYDRSRAEEADNQLILQYTVSLGAHGAHPF